jgi:hypothetical protein
MFYIMQLAKIKKTALIVFIAALIIMQFIPYTKNNGEVMGTNHVSNVVQLPADVEQILTRSCYDCHSNNTFYPWYSHIQPVGFWLQHHVNEGKDELNFSEFAKYKKKRQLHKLDEIIEMMELHEMPLASYTVIHSNAKLSKQQELILVEWAKASKTQLKDTTNTE